MTSKQVMLAAVVLAVGGCALPRGLFKRQRPASPYESRKIFAVAPLRNESGSLHADGVRLADHLAHQLENVPKIDVLAVNRTIAAMEALGIDQITSLGEARTVMKTVGCDGLIIGSITAYEPYDPPTLGLALELYTEPRQKAVLAADPRVLAKSATPVYWPITSPADAQQPVSSISGVYHASERRVRRRMQRYARWRGQIKDTDAWHQYRISMDLYSQFIAYVTSERLMAAEAARFRPSREVKEPAS